MRIYVHRQAAHDADAVETAETVAIAEALEVDDGDVVLVEDREVELDLTQSFADAGVADRAHVFHGKHTKVVAAVQYNGQTIEREFSSSSRVDQVFRWATGHHGFNLSKADAAEHTLQLPDDTVPHGDVHLGSLGHERVVFSLIPKHRYEG